MGENVPAKNIANQFEIEKVIVIVFMNILMLLEKDEYGKIYLLIIILIIIMGNNIKEILN